MIDNFELWARGNLYSRKRLSQGQGNIVESGKEYTTVTLSNTTNFTMLNTMSF